MPKKLNYTIVFFDNSADKKMTQKNKNFQQSAETRARQRENFFLHVDILLKS